MQDNNITLAELKFMRLINEAGAIAEKNGFTGEI